MIPAPTLFIDPQPQRRAIRRAPDPEYPEWAPLACGSLLLALDPSIARCGWAVLRKVSRWSIVRIDSGILHPRGRQDCTRFDDLARQIDQLIETHHPTDAVVELPYGIGQGGRAMLDYARAVGICETVPSLRGLGMNRARVGEWKGREKKSRTASIVRALLRYEPSDHNEADALGLGLWLCAK